MKREHVITLCLLIVGTAVGTLIALAVAGKYAQSQYQDSKKSNPLLKLFS